MLLLLFKSMIFVHVSLVWIYLSIILIVHTITILFNFHNLTMFNDIKWFFA